ncbi:MAG TPA: selenium-dependent xanthine dehydrogenase [Candidatus Limnocylindrales bacterium]|nr:selenium-dependent xanthine dehydrogenase [Candidatus Limnocylindrales bacterium]
MEISFSLNGQPVSVEVRDGERLMEVLRDRFGLRSMKDGCAPEGSCGACTVLVDGRAAVSCAQDATRVQGRAVVTLEGLPEATRDLFAGAFVAAGAAQCGYCTPGIVMKAEATLNRDPAATREALARSLTGNLCRCTGYVKVLDAIETVAAVRRGEAPLAAAATGTGVGARADRYDGRDLVLGEFAFVRDMTVEGMLHGAVTLSAHPRAIVKRIDTSRAEQVPGVVRVATWRDVPGRRNQGLIFPDWPVLVAEGETTRYVGDVLAAVAADTRHAAREAAELVEVEYEVLTPVVSAAAALAEDAPRVHEGGNLLATSEIRIGDVDAALAGAAHVVSETFRTQAVEHAFLEPEACLAVPEPGDDEASRLRPRLRIFSQGQGVWEDRHQIASLLGLEEHEVRVTQVATGGGFGGKEDLSVQGQAALLAFLTGRPVHLALSRAESLRLHPKRHALVMDYTAGCDAEGHLLGVRARIVGDTGAYASVGDKVLERAAGHACSAYRVPAVDVEARTVYTNNPPCGAFRGFGAVQVAFAMEGMLDLLAEKVGIDGWEIRWRNALEVGDRFGTGQKLGPGVGLKKTLLAVRDAYRSAPFAGIACGAKNVGVGNGMRESGRAILRPEADGTVTLYHSWTEMGQGIHTVLRQILVDELGVSPDQVRIVVDTERELNTGETTASRATTLGGQAVIDAARRLRAEAGDRPLSQFEGREFYGEYVVDWTTKSDVPEPITHFAYGWATQVVILDEDGKLDRVIAAQDVGRIMNPAAMEGQVEGGIHMGLGMALSEDLGLHDGMPVGTLKELGIIPPSGMPPVECILVEEHQPEGPYGAKGAGEAVLVPTPGAVAGALFAFDGVHRTTLPMRDTVAAKAAAPNVARLLARAEA